LRKERRLSQEQLAHLATLDRTYVSSCEAGRRNVSIRTIVRLAIALDVDPAALASGPRGEAVVDVTIRVTWADGSTSRHRLSGLPYDDLEVAAEVLEHKLADYLDLDDDWPTDSAGLPLGWVVVQVIA
jgi:transcriptional regulator with XRE-family HTH domain